MSRCWQLSAARRDLLVEGPSHWRRSDRWRAELLRTHAGDGLKPAMRSPDLRSPFRPIARPTAAEVELHSPQWSGQKRVGDRSLAVPQFRRTEGVDRSGRRV